MATPTVIHGRESPGGPPLHLQTSWSKMRWSQKHPPAEPNVSYEGKTVLVTGANIGLGFEAAIKYAKKGATKLFLGVRSVQKGEDTKEVIVQRTGYDRGRIVVVPVDLSSFASVQSFVKNLEKETHELDVVLLNAGIVYNSYVKSPEGWEMAVQVNVLSTALMAVLLLPLLRQSAAVKQEIPHMTFVNSAGHMDVKSEWWSGSLLQAANDESTFDVKHSYCVVKLLGMAVMEQVARATTGSDGTPEIIVNACCPYMTKTNLGRNFPLYYKIMMSVFHYFTARTTEEGSRTLVSATALGPESHGRFWLHDILHP